MKTIGIIGGMSWESSLEYYRIINQIIRERLGGLHSARSLMLSVDFSPIEKMQADGDWDSATQEMVQCAKHLEAGGADCILIATNTMHLMFDAVQEATSLPTLHIADAAAKKIRSMDLTTVGLLGTQFTMEMDFYTGRLEKKFGIRTLTPDRRDRGMINQVIYEELVLGKIKNESKQRFLRVIGKMQESGAQGIILGCTEIPLLVKQGDTSIPLFDTTYLHAESAVDFALSA